MALIWYIKSLYFSLYPDSKGIESVSVAYILGSLVSTVQDYIYRRAFVQSIGSD